MKYLFGASGHAKVIADIIISIKDYDIIGVFDDNKNFKSFQNIPFLGKLKPGSKILNQGEFIIAIGNNKTRKQIVKKLKTTYFTAVHAKSSVSKYSQLGEGTVVMSNATVNSNTQIGNHCIINTSSVVEHDCKIGDFVHISPNATITGGVKIGEGTHVGAGAVIIPNITIGKWCVIGAGSVVIENIPDLTKVVGNPARIIKNSI